jgi:hypothetical protein
VLPSELGGPGGDVRIAAAGDQHQPEVEDVRRAQRGPGALFDLPGRVADRLTAWLTWLIT